MPWEEAEPADDPVPASEEENAKVWLVILLARSSLGPVKHNVMSAKYISSMMRVCRTPLLGLSLELQARMKGTGYIGILVPTTFVSIVGCHGRNQKQSTQHKHLAPFLWCQRRFLQRRPRLQLSCMRRRCDLLGVTHHHVLRTRCCSIHHEDVPELRPICLAFSQKWSSQQRHTHPIRKANVCRLISAEHKTNTRLRAPSPKHAAELAEKDAMWSSVTNFLGAGHEREGSLTMLG